MLLAAEPIIKQQEQNSPAHQIILFYVKLFYFYGDKDAGWRVKDSENTSR